jgi:PPM family protein phosphatase
MRRRNNQDSLSVVLSNDISSWQRNGHLLIVADGMGAHAAGELASKLSVELIPHHFAKLLKGMPAEALQKSLVETNQEIFRKGQANPEFRSMGTTTCALGIFQEGAVVAHVGDSRVYRLRNGLLEQLTFDHSLVWEMRASGDMSEEALRNNAIPKNVITRSLGPSPTVAVDLEGPFPYKDHDKFLICSDGLSGQLSDEEIGVLLMLLDGEEAVEAMIHLANLRGGPDNITVVIGEVRDAKALLAGSIPTSNPSLPEPKYPVVFGAIAAACLLASVFMLLVGLLPIAALALGAAAIAFGTGWYKYQNQRYSAPLVNQLGKGPYRKAKCKPDSHFAGQLLAVIRELDDWVAENHWHIESVEIDSCKREAAAAEQANDHSNAIRKYVRVIALTMKEVKKAQQDQSASDSNIDY